MSTSERRYVSVKKIESYHLEDEIENVISLLQDIRERFSGELTLSIDDIVPYADDIQFSIEVLTPESDEDYNQRLKDSKVELEREKARRYENYLELKKEFGE